MTQTRPATFTYAREAMTAESWDRLLPLFQRHWVEIGHFGDIPLDPDRDRYLDMEARGASRWYVARDEAGEAVGYACFFVVPHLHYRRSLTASQDVVYVPPEYRGAGVGSAILDFCEEQLRAEGVQVVVHHVKRAHPALGRVLERRGYEPMDTIYVKRLDR